MTTIGNPIYQTVIDKRGNNINNTNGDDEVIMQTPFDEDDKTITVNSFGK